VRALLRASEADAGPWKGEGIWLAEQPLVAMRNWFPDAYERVVAILQQMAAAGLMLTPTEADMTGPIKDVVSKYYQGANIEAYDRVRLFRIVWDLIGTQFGSRSTLYERYFNGDIVRLRQVRYTTYDYTSARRSYHDFLGQMG